MHYMMQCQENVNYKRHHAAEERSPLNSGLFFLCFLFVVHGIAQGNRVLCIELFYGGIMKGEEDSLLSRRILYVCTVLYRYTVV